MEKQTFISKLKRTNKEIREERATALGKVAARQFKSLYDNKVNAIEALDEELEELFDLSTSNTAYTLNRIKGEEFRNRDLVAKQFELDCKRIVLLEELRVLEKREKFYGVELTKYEA